jgi:hypothetical protein
MAFIAGKGFAILNSKAEKGDAKAKELLSKLDSIDQDEADRLFSEILGKGGGGSKKDKKIKAPGASATDGQGEITEGAGEQAPTGKATPKGKDYQLEINDLTDKLSEIRQGRMDGDVKKIRARIKELEGKKKAQGKAEPEVAAPAEPTGEVIPQKDNMRGFKKAAEAAGVELIFGKKLNKQLDDLPSTNRGGVLNNYDGFYVAPDGSKVRYKIRGEKITDENGNEANNPEDFINTIKGGNAEPTSEVEPAPKTRQDLLKKLNDFGIPTSEIATKAAELDKAGIKDNKQFISEMLKLTENKEPLKRGGKNAKAFVEKFTQDKPYFQDDYQQEEIGTAYELLNGDERLTEAAAQAGAQFQVSPSFIKDNKLVVPYGDGDFEYAEGDYYTQDQENRLNIIDLEKFAKAQGIGGGSAAGNSVEQVVQGNIQSDIEPDFQSIADEFGITKEEVIDVYNNQLEQNDAAVEIDTAGANVQPAGAFGDIEPETQQLAQQGRSLQDFIKEDEDFAKEFATTDAQGNELPKSGQVKDGYYYPDTKRIETLNNATDAVNEILDQRGSISNQEAELLAREFKLPVADVLDIIEQQKIFEQSNRTPDEQDRQEFEMMDVVEQSKTKPLTNDDIQRLIPFIGGTQEQVTQELDKMGARFGSDVQIYQPESSLQKIYTDPREQIDDIMQTGRGGVSKQEAAEIAAEFGISVDEVRQLERQSQTEIPFPAPDGEAIPADQDFDEQGNPETKLDPVEQKVDRQMKEYDARANEIINGIEQFTSGGRFELSDDDWNDYYYEMQRMSTSSPVAEKWLRNNSPKGNANAQAAGVQPAAKPQSQQPAAGTPDRKKVEAAAVELGINADLLEGLLELIKRIK